MLDAISNHIKQTITQWGKEDSIILNQEMHQINQQNFHTIPSSNEDKTIAFIDGGQAEILQTGNFCLSLIRVAIVIFKKNKELIKILDYFDIIELFTNTKFIIENPPILRDCMDTTVIINPPKTNLLNLKELFLKNNSNYSIILEEGSIKGIVTLKDLINQIPKNIDLENLFSLIKKILSDDDLRKTMEHNAKQLAKPRAASDVAESLKELCE